MERITFELLNLKDYNINLLRGHISFRDNSFEGLTNRIMYFFQNISNFEIALNYIDIKYKDFDANIIADVSESIKTFCNELFSDIFLNFYSNNFNYFLSDFDKLKTKVYQLYSHNHQIITTSKYANSIQSVMELFSFYEKIFECFYSYFVNKQANSLLRIELFNVKDFIKFISFEYKLDFIGNFALLFLHKDNINEYFEEIKLQSNFIFPDNYIFGFHSKLDNLKVNIIKEIEEYNNYRKVEEDDPRKQISIISDTTNKLINDKLLNSTLFNELLKFGLISKRKELDSFVKGKNRKLLFEFNETKIKIYLYELGFILISLGKINKKFIPNRCSIILTENERPYTCDYSKLYSNLKQYGLALSEDKVRQEFSILYKLLKENYPSN